MTSESFSVHNDGLSPAPKLNNSFKSLDIEKKSRIEVPAVSGFSASRSLKSRVEKFPSSCLDFMKDARWMSLIVSVFTIASQSCALVSESAGFSVPILNIVSSPFLLYTTVKASQMRFRLVKYAAKTSQPVEALFWSGRGIGSIGATISNLIKPFAGGLRISGLHSLPGVALTFTVIFPALLICLGAIGGATEGWSMMRNIRVFKEFKQQRAEVDENLENLDQLLTFLMGPQKSAFAGRELEYEISLRFFKDTHFTNESRREGIQQRVGDLINKTEDASQFYQDLLDPKASHLQNIETALCLYEKLIKAYSDLGLEEDSVKELVAEMKSNFQQLTELKNSILQKGKAILELSESEMHRILMQNAVTILIATLSLIAGVLFLLPGPCPLIASALAITTAIFTITNVFFEKSVSQERFLALERFFTQKVKFEMKFE